MSINRVVSISFEIHGCFQTFASTFISILNIVVSINVSFGIGSRSQTKLQAAVCLYLYPATRYWLCLIALSSTPVQNLASFQMRGNSLVASPDFGFVLHLLLIAPLGVKWTGRCTGSGMSHETSPEDDQFGGLENLCDMHCRFNGFSSSE